MTHNARRTARNAILIGVILLFTGRVSAETDWNIKKSKHFIVYYQEAPAEYINEVIRKAERYYQTITDYLGFRRFNFWTWDKRCKIYLYPGRKEYLGETSSIFWSRGSVHIIRKEIVTYVWEEEFLDYVLPHELGHIIFREVVGFDKKLPLWLDEAVAVLQESNRKNYLLTARLLVKEGRYIHLEELSEIRDYKLVVPLVFYSESASIIEFLLSEFGKDRFITFCRRLRDGNEWKEALLKTYRFKDLNALEEAWVKRLQN